MIPVDWTAMMLGAGVGVVTSALFFLGLAIGMRHALRGTNPVPLLAISAAIRIFVLLGVGWIMVVQGGPWAALGYAVAFVLTRVMVTTFARIAPPVGDAR